MNSRLCSIGVTSVATLIPLLTLALWRHPRPPGQGCCDSNFHAEPCRAGGAGYVYRGRQLDLSAVRAAPLHLPIRPSAGARTPPPPSSRWEPSP